MQDAEAAATAAEQRCAELRATQAAVEVEVDALSDAKVQARLILLHQEIKGHTYCSLASCELS